MMEWWNDGMVEWRKLPQIPKDGMAESCPKSRKTKWLKVVPESCPNPQRQNDGKLPQVLKGVMIAKLPQILKDGMVMTESHISRTRFKFPHRRHSPLYRVLEMRSIDRNRMLNCITSWIWVHWMVLLIYMPFLCLLECLEAGRLAMGRLQLSGCKHEIVIDEFSSPKRGSELRECKNLELFLVVEQEAVFNLSFLWDDTGIFPVFEMQIGMNEFDQRISALLNQQWDRPENSGINGDLNVTLTSAIPCSAPPLELSGQLGADRSRGPLWTRRCIYGLISTHTTNCSQLAW